VKKGGNITQGLRKYGMKANSSKSLLDSPFKAFGSLRIPIPGVKKRPSSQSPKEGELHGIKSRKMEKDWRLI